VELVPYVKSARKPGRLKGKISIPGDLDADNEQIADWFEGR
jgi:hypothetical protein